MTRRERFENILKHQKVDRPLFDLYGCRQTTVMSQKTTDDLKRLLGITGEYTGSQEFDERILERFNTDTRMTGGFPHPASPHYKTLPNGYVEEWGIEYRSIGGHYEIVGNPLKDMELDELKQFAFPDPNSVPQSFFDGCREHAKRLYEDTDYVVVAEHPVYGVFETGCWMFGFDDFLYRLAAEPETVIWFFDKIWDYQRVIIERYYEAIGDYIHATTSGDDFGTQRGMFMSLPMFRELVAPYYKKRIDLTKSITRAAYQHHTCGSVYELIPTLIECGVDILNPIQPMAFHMEPEALKAAYGDKIAFWGGIDTQDLLVNKTPDQVKDEVRRILKIFGNDGCYILSPAHCIQEDVPAENV
ncbi:MAG: methyltransferase, partial [Clostridia bacterium]|nr:methyltransferase [Clostridia bacterium]